MTQPRFTVVGRDLLRDDVRPWAARSPADRRRRLHPFMRAAWLIVLPLVVALPLIADNRPAAIGLVLMTVAVTYHLSVPSNVAEVSHQIDSVLLLWVDGVILASVAIWERNHGVQQMPLVVGAFAVSGALLLAYSRARVLASAGLDMPDGPFGIAAREVRLLVIAIALALGFGYWGLLAAGMVAHAATLINLVWVRSLTATQPS